MRKIYETMAISKFSTPTYDIFMSELKNVVAPDRIYTDELRTLGWGTDASFYRQIPKVVIRSDNEDEVCQIVKLCSKHQLPFTFRAAGTSLSGQSCSDSVLIVAGKHWEKYELGENVDTIRLQPGIVGGKVNEILKPYGRVDWFSNGGWYCCQQCIRYELWCSCQQRPYDGIGSYYSYRWYCP